MADKYLNSNQISVYPSGYRSASVDLEASRTTEGSVRKALLAPLTQKSFAKFEEDNSMTLVLGGYVFNISQEGISVLETTFSSAYYIYAYIDVQPIATMVDDIESSLKMLVNVETQTSVLDESNLFKGIKFTDTLPNTTTYPNQLKILVKTNTSWVIPAQSQFVISTDHIYSAGYNYPISDSFEVHSFFKVGNSVATALMIDVGNGDDSPNEIYMDGHIQLGDDTGFYWGADDYSITRDIIHLKGGLIYSNSPLTLSSNSNKVEIGSSADFYINKIKGSNLSLGIDSSGKVYSEDQSSTYTRTSDNVNVVKVISGITQNSMGKITSYSETNLPLASTTVAGLVSTDAQTFEGVKTFNKKIVGNIDTSDAFSSNATITLSGDVSGTASSTKGWSITTTIGENKVVTSKIADRAITSAKIAKQTILTENIHDDAVTTSQISNDSVTTAKIKDANVTTAKIANGNVTNAKLANSSITLGSTKCTLGNTYTTINGLSKIYSSEFYANSDRRLKENFREVEFNKSILDLPIYKFDFINGAKDQIGCVAQELQEICPELVAKGEDGFLSIQESKLVYLLIDEVKKLKKEVDELKRGE